MYIEFSSCEAKSVIIITVVKCVYLLNCMNNNVNIPNCHVICSISAVYVLMHYFFECKQIYCHHDSLPLDLHVSRYKFMINKQNTDEENDQSMCMVVCLYYTKTDRQMDSHTQAHMHTQTYV